MPFAALLLSLALAQPDAWPTFHGARRDNRSDATGLLQQWPAEGPRLLWRSEIIGHGFAGVAVVDGRIYTAGNVGEKTVISALDLAGKPVWQAQNGNAYSRSYPGSRGTPTVAGGRLFHLNGDGELIALGVADGKPLWSRSLKTDFGGRSPRWGFAESPLVLADKVVVCPGGESVAMVALDPSTGRTLWQCRGAGDPPGYASAIEVDYAGLKQIVAMTGKSVIGVESSTGRLLWRYEREAPYEVNATTPVYHEGHVAIFTTWGRGTTLLKLRVTGNDCQVEKVWHNSEFDNEHGGVVLLNGHLYGHVDGNHKKRRWACAEWSTGKITYIVEALRGATGAITYADGRLYLVGDRGDIALQVPTPEGFKLVGQFKLPAGGEGPVWAHPVVCGGRLYLRHGNLLFAYDVAASGERRRDAK